ncbi:GNAT family N-acetyltransferase [Streptococcus pantholopis]|uniref:Acetyltransferase n=1 Tax=Streptococcus pantholopis TaxID=1811193 RepID=A0A172Q6U2_9STRE|nr:GNAT family N-acetyltransferase [Streptococcus pantholopis]AND79184.1 acetyltransferase [Streptococcus pantholopis]
MVLREIQQRDNRAVACLIRKTLEEFSLDKDGTAYYDPQLEDLSAYYAKESRGAYFVVDENGSIAASGGFAPISLTVAELQKLYVRKDCRGKGYASLLMDKILAAAKARGFQQLYLETTALLSQAVNIYKHYGFRQLDSPLLHENGHSAMDIWMIKDL